MRGTVEERQSHTVGPVNDASYRSFVIRVWERPTARPSTRVEIEQVQTGAGAVLRGTEAERFARTVEESLRGGGLPARRK